MDIDSVIREITDAVIKDLDGVAASDSYACKAACIPAAVSNRHVHLSHEHASLLFGSAQMTKVKTLSQPGQYACEEKVMLAGPKGAIENVRVLGPIRDKTQVEMSASDCNKLGITAPLRHSGDLDGSAGITIIGPCGAIILEDGAIIAARHIHMHPADAHYFKMADREKISVKVIGPRGLIFNEVLVRVRDDYKLEMHIDFDEANAAGIRINGFVEVVKC